VENFDLSFVISLHPKMHSFYHSPFRC